MTYTAKIVLGGIAYSYPLVAGAPAIPGFRFDDNSVAEGYLNFHLGTSFDKTVTPVYSIGPYTATIFNNGVQVGAPVTIQAHFWNSDWWYDLGTMPVTVIRTPVELIAAGYVPPFGAAGFSGTVWPKATECVFAGPMTLASGVTGYEPTTGGRYDIGICSGWAADWLVNGNLANMLEVAKGVATMPIWNWDDTPGAPTGKLIDLTVKPKTTSYFDNQQGTVDWLGPYPTKPTEPTAPAVQIPLQPSTPDTAHMLDVCGVVALATGSPRYVRALQARTIRGFNESNAGVSTFGTVTVTNRQLRGTAWLLRELFYCYNATLLAEKAGNLPADCLTSSTWMTIINDQATIFAEYIELSPVFQTYNIWPMSSPDPVSFWECDYLNQVLGLYAGMWPLTWGPIYLKTIGNLMARVNGDGKKQWPVAYPSWYWGAVCSDTTDVAGKITYGTKPFASWSALWTAWSEGQAAGTDTTGNNGYLTAAQVAALNADPTNGGTYIKGWEYLCWLNAALAYAVYLDQGALKGQVSAMYPNLMAAYEQQHAMMVKYGDLIPACSLVVASSAPLPTTTLTPAPTATFTGSVVLSGAVTLADGTVLTVAPITLLVSKAPVV